MTIIKQPTAIGLIPYAFVIVKIIDDVRSIIEVGSIRQPSMKRNKFIISNTINLLFTAVSIVVEMAFPIPLLDIHHAIPAAEQTIISIAPTETAVSAKHLAKIFSDKFLYRNAPTTQA